MDIINLYALIDSSIFDDNNLAFTKIEKIVVCILWGSLDTLELRGYLIDLVF